MTSALVARRPRPQVDRERNDRRARIYGQTIRGYLGDLARDPQPLASIAHHMGRMHEVARATVPSAFLEGKRQAIDDLAAVTTTDQLWIESKLQRNEHFLHTSLGPAIADKLSRRRERDPDAVHRMLDQSVGSRVENLYGGVLWTSAEAGYRSGAQELHRSIEALKGRLIVQDDEVVEPVIGQRRKKRNWLVILARLLGMDPDELEAEYQSLTVGLSYVTSGDGRVCDPCAEAEGEYFAPETCPLPGEVCLGLAACRCHVEVVTRSLAA